MITKYRLGSTIWSIDDLGNYTCNDLDVNEHDYVYSEKQLLRMGATPLLSTKTTETEKCECGGKNCSLGFTKHELKPHQPQSPIDPQPTSEERINNNFQEQAKQQPHQPEKCTCYKVNEKWSVRNLNCPIHGDKPHQPEAKYACPKCHTENTENWPILVDGKVQEGGCQSCWEADCDKSWWEMVAKSKPHQPQKIDLPASSAFATDDAYEWAAAVTDRLNEEGADK